MSETMQRWIDAMRQGDFDLAWSLSRASMAQRCPSSRNDHSLPYHLRWVWDGRPFDDRHVLVRCYHGLGDTIQFARFLPALARRAASLDVEAQPRLLPLLATMSGIRRLIPFDEANPSPESECDIEITELGMALAAHPGQFPPPYINHRPVTLPAGVIGICHAAGDWDADRSVPPEMFGDICEHHACVTLVAGPSELPVINPDGCPFDIERTAAIVAGVDLVLTVDTMIAHLAGAMGKPTWLLLKAEPDWRWSPREESSVWYPSMRLFAQPRPGDWGTVIARVEAELATQPMKPAEQQGGVW